MTEIQDAPRPLPDQNPVEAPDRRRLLLRVVAVLVVAALVAVAWKWTPLRGLLNLDRMASWMEPHRRAWYGLPIVILVFVVLALLMVPVSIPILATGLALGPWLGSLYALIGALTSATLAYAVGRKVGPERVERVAGSKVRRISDKISESGPLAVFLVRKTPLPSTIVNVAIGASGARFRDFILGSMLGLVPLVLALDAFEGSLGFVLRNATPGNVAVAALFLVIPLLLAIRINRALKRSKMSTP
jgi:uncharacterized membrane protein YdjX (TVP38/TMEM64 family)